MDSLTPKAVQKNLENSTQILWEKLVEYIPNIFGTIILLVVGYFISKTGGQSLYQNFKTPWNR